MFILGDLFEAWVGDDVVDAEPVNTERRFIRHCVAALRDAATRAPLYVMRGNRDFLLGESFAQQTGVQLIDDPCVLTWGASKWLLSHGDAWCIDDVDYLRFRETVRGSAWQSAFLAQPLAEREQVARALRERSEAAKQDRVRQGEGFADVDTATARHWLTRTGCPTLIHGHTHQPGDHDLGQGLRRVVLSDWDAAAPCPRMEVLSLSPDGHWTRRPLSPCG